MAKIEQKQRIFYLTDAEVEIFKKVGDGNMSEGVRVSARWATHFFNIGLTTDIDLNYVGLITIADNEHE
jgi:hypothetical protein